MTTGIMEIVLQNGKAYYLYMDSDAYNLPFIVKELINSFTINGKLKDIFNPNPRPFTAKQFRSRAMDRFWFLKRYEDLLAPNWSIPRKAKADFKNLYLDYFITVDTRNRTVQGMPYSVFTSMKYVQREDSWLKADQVTAQEFRDTFSLHPR